MAVLESCPAKEAAIPHNQHPYPPLVLFLLLCGGVPNAAHNIRESSPETILISTGFSDPAILSSTTPTRLF